MNAVQRMLEEASRKNAIFAHYGIDSASARADDIPEEVRELLVEEGLREEVDDDD